MDPRQVNADLIAAADAKRVDARSQDVTVSEAWAVYIEDRRYEACLSQVMVLFAQVILNIKM